MPASTGPGTTADDLDLAALTGFLRERWGRDPGQVKARLLSGGRSNLTYEVTAGDRSMVLRRPPRGLVLETAHDMGREARVMAALHDSAVPVPEVIAHCADADVLGVPFYLMSKVDGRVLRTADDLAALTAGEAAALTYSLVDTLAALHVVDPGAVGLADFGRPEGYLERQVRRWRRQLAGVRTRDIPGFDSLADGLARTVPPSPRAAIVHGDYRHDNVVIDAADPGRVRAVLDWEMATLGDPLADLGLLHVYWVGWAGIDNPIAAAPGALPHFPGWPDVAERYAARTGFSLEHLGFHVALAFFKLAVICEGIHARHARGLTAGEGFERIGGMVPPLVERGLAALEG